MIVQAVAARDRKKAEAYAKKHGIPQVFGGYQELLDDPSIDAVYIPLPNGLHLEWALKALAKGKHVLLEKPSVCNAEEADLLFHSPLLQPSPTNPQPPILLEAFHYRFQPSWLVFLTLIDPPNVEHAKAVLYVPRVAFASDDIRFRYDLGGGSLLDLNYTMSVLRVVFGAEPVECTACDVKTMPPPFELCDYRYDATWRFPNGGTGETHATLQASLRETVSNFPAVTVRHRPVVVANADVGAGKEVEAGEEVTKTRTVTLHNFIMGVLWHRIDVEDEFVVRRAEGGEVVRRWTVKESRKAYTYREAGVDRESEPFWKTYKYQLDAFVDRVRGREGTGEWVNLEDSLGLTKMVDMAYEKSVLPLRETSKFRLEG